METYIRFGEGKPVSAINFDEKGNTGNVREGDDITIVDSTIPGDNSNKMTLDVSVNIVLQDGDVYTNPQATIAIYDGAVMTKESFVAQANENGWFNYLLPEGQSEWTVESYAETLEAKGIDPWSYAGTMLNAEIYANEITVEGTFNEATGQMEYIITIDGKIYTITELGIEGEMKELWMQNKLHKVKGEDTNAEDLNDPDDSDDPDPGPGGTPGGGGQWSDMGVASVSANVYSNQYDVSTAIPTSENVHGSISASDMSWYYNVVKKYDSVDATITVSLYWDPYIVWVDDGYTYTTSTGVEVFVKTGEHPETRYASSSTEAVTGVYSTHYFGVAEAHMNKLGGGSVSNPAVGQIASVGAANIGGSISRDGGIVFNSGRMNYSSFSSYGEGYGDALGGAQSVIRGRLKNASKVKNDNLVIKSAVLWGITDNWGEEFKGTPYIYPSHLVSPSSSMMSGSGVKMIPSNKPNGNYQSSASASYPMVPGFDGQGTYSKGAGAPSVFVHTPVVNRATITSEAFINQKVVQESGLTYLQLDKKFVINIPRDGTHIGARGYGTRNYNSYQAVPGYASNWGKIKDVKLPFDAYLQPSNTLIKAGKWLSDNGLATSQESYTFLIPVWAEEAKGTIETRVVAENALAYPNGSSCPTGLLQDGANLDYTKYIAEKKILVEVIGKIYDLRISGTNDPGWPGIKGKEGPYITAQEFPFGQAGQNSQKQYRFAPKLGYIVEFDFKTKGVKTDNVDVSVQPEGFYFVSKDGGEAQEVDLFFKTVTNQYIKIDPSTNNSDIIVNLSNQFMRVVVQEIIDSRRIMIDQVGVTYTYNQNVSIGQLPALKMPEKLRLCYNNFAEYVNRLYGKSEAGITADANGGLSYSTGKYDAVNNGKDTVIASVGHWYAGYRLPSSTIAVPKGTSVNQILRNPNIAKENGYILVKFDIVGKNGDEDYLRYTGPESITEPGNYTKDEDNKEQKWQDPQGNPDPTSPKQDIDLPNGKTGIVPDGTVILFETDLRANNDYEVIGTH